YLQMMESIASKNQVFRSFIGQGYYNTITPSPIARNIFQNPGWYTQYTPYQAEISQGRLEALLNFQTMVSDLTGLPIANASLLDEATAAAEAMTMFHDIKNKRRKEDSADKIFVDQHVFRQTLGVLRSRAEPLGIEIVIGDWRSFTGGEEYFAVLCQFPDAEGSVNDYRDWIASMKEQEIYAIVAADILGLVLLSPPGEWGADAVVGSTQRFGVPMGFGGPHAAYFATREDYKRQIPGRIIGVSLDSREQPALRMALQTREQHIKREKATSNICTAQALLAIMAGMYAVYHGPDGLTAIARQVHELTRTLASLLAKQGVRVRHSSFFDTVCIDANEEVIGRIRETAEQHGVNFCYDTQRIGVSLDETTTAEDVEEIAAIMAAAGSSGAQDNGFGIHEDLRRTTPFCTHEVFSSYNTETELMRYIKRLENKDLSLMHSMIPLGSCTMKLNAATQLIPVSWSAFADMHPFAPAEQTAGYQQIIRELENDLCEITGLAACSLMPNSGAQGELTGLLCIRAYHAANDDHQRDVALIPSSAHGTNPASAVMAGMRVVVVQCDDTGNIDVDDLRAKAAEYRDHLAALMVTYPSTHGVFEEAIKEICATVHEYGGLVYMDGANMNAQVGLTSPGEIDADVCHLNLHKTFSIPHGGGGPGMGPICVNEKLKPYLPVHPYAELDGSIDPVAAAPWGSASILLISYAYIKLLGAEGMRRA
ncbi:MAG: aminomethyl-transferring glycine dehydrogenase, partial [Saprospiraceae bacterium]|nr:aminomethyl-transferring glycine dehydrogenase [Saprospiraceae bacterium]